MNLKLVILKQETESHKLSASDFTYYSLRFLFIYFFFLQSYKFDPVNSILKYSANRREHFKAMRIFNSCSKSEEKVKLNSRKHITMLVLRRESDS
jgi:hypothetical protein